MINYLNKIGRSTFASILIEQKPETKPSFTCPNCCYQILTSIAPSQTGFLQLQTEKKKYPSMRLRDHFLPSSQRIFENNTSLVACLYKTLKKINKKLRPVLRKYHELRRSITRIFEYAQS